LFFPPGLNAVLQGIYFADAAKKSSGYLRMGGGGKGSQLAETHGCLLLAEVALGRVDEQLAGVSELKHV